MTHKNHLWRPDRPPPEIRAHSIAKHRVLDVYLRRYVETLTQKITVERLPLTIVDGFAGGNVYTDPQEGVNRPGSPSIILHALSEAEAVANVRRTKRFRIVGDYFFIEKDRGAFESLRASLAAVPYSREVREAIRLLQGNFADHASQIIEFINRKSRRGRSIFILDQCGFSGVPFRIIRNIFGSIPHAEVILTFAAEHLIDHLRDAGSNPTLKNNPELDLDELASEMDKSDRYWKRRIQTRLSPRLQKLTGAKFFTPFFLRSKDSHRDLWLAHLSRHHRARDVMVGVHWDLGNCFSHYGGAGLKMLLGYDQADDVQLTGQPKLYVFDELAAEWTREALSEDLPKLLRDEYREVDFRTLFSDISNQTPATSRILRGVLRTLCEEGRVIIKDESKLTTRKVGIQRETDVIMVPPQRLLFY